MKANNCMIDWLEFSVFDKEIEVVMLILEIDDLNFEQRKGFYYKDMYVYDDCIYISKGMKGNAEDDHVHVKITGRGCRLLEKKLNAKNLRDEFRDRFMQSDKVKVSRLDICVDYDEKFVVKYMNDVYNKNLDGVRTTQIVGEKDNGMTFYLGSRKSEKFFRAYEKDHESGNFELYKDRLELVLKDEYATFEFNSEKDLYEIISTYMSEIEWYDSVLQEGWENMKGQQCEISPKIRHKKTTLEEKADYILSTYGKTLKAYAEQYGTIKITEAIHEAILSQKDLRMLNNAKVISMIRIKKKLSEKQEQKQDKPETVTYEQLAL